MPGVVFSRHSRFGEVGTPPKDGAHLTSHDLIYRGPMEYWQSGILLGNGDTAVIAYQPNSQLCFGITRAGLFDKRNRMQVAKTHQEIRDLWERGRIDEILEWDKFETVHYHREPYPTPRAAGVLTIDAGADINSLKQTLTLKDAILVQDADDLRVESIVSTLHDCLCIEIKTDRPFSVSFSAAPDYPNKNNHWWDNYGGIGEEVESKWEARENGFVGRCSFPGGDAYCVSIKLDGKAEGAGSNWRVTPVDGIARIYLAVASDTDGADFAEQAVKRTAAAAQMWFERIRAKHRRDWHDYWSVNLLAMEDRFLENLFYLGQYLLRCGLGGRSNFGGMNSWHLGNQPWHGDMHVNINVEMLWLPVFPLNRAKLSDSFDSHFVAHADDARKESRRFWQMPGLTYPFVSAGDLRPLYGGIHRYEIYVSAWVSQVFWDRYRFSGDEKYLREVCYPFQKEILLFYENYVEKNEDGQYFIPMSKPVEGQRGPDNTPFVKDMLLDIASLRQLLQATIRASEILGQDEKDRARWKELLANLVPLPADHERRMFVAYRGADPFLLNDHPTTLGPLFPSGPALTDEELDYERNCLENITRVARRHMGGFPFKKIFPWGDDLSYSWISIAAARLGDRERVYRYLYDYLVLLQLKKNGLFASRPSDVATRDRKVSLFNTVGGFMLAMTEMFLQSFDDVIRVFPAAPEGFTATFAGLKAAGNFTVDAAQVDGKLLYIRLSAGSDGTAALRNYWGSARVTDGAGNVTTRNEQIIHIPMKAGQTCLITPMPEVELTPLTFETEARQTPRTWTGPRYLEQLPPEETWTISLGQ